MRQSVDLVRLRQEKVYDNAEADRFEWLTWHANTRRADLPQSLAIADRAHALHESARMLAPGGRLCVIDGSAATLVSRLFAAMLFPRERQRGAPRSGGPIP